MAGDAVVGFERALIGTVGGLEVMLALVVRADRRLQLLVVPTVQHRPERGHAQREHEHPRGCADDRR